MPPTSHIRRPPIVVSPPNLSTVTPATLIFIHRYNDVATSYARDPPNQNSLAHHIHMNPSLRHVKVIIPEALPSIHPSVRKNVWYDMPTPIPQAFKGTARDADAHVEFGHSENYRDDMNVTLDYFEELIRAEIANGTPAGRIVMMGYSQGAGMVMLFLQTRKLAADLGAVITYAGFPPTPLQSVFDMQRQYGMTGRWSKETKLFMMHGREETFVPLVIFWSWLRQLEGFRDRGQGIASIDWQIIDGAGHPLHEDIWPKVGEILERVVPDKLPLKL